MVELSILDYALIDEGENADIALKNSIKLATLADQLGYKRFWLTEHHNVPAFACSSPELLMMQLLAQTSRIRLGSGGVMLPHYSPYKVAEQFRVLESFYPNRVDLGIGNNPGTTAVRRALDGEHPRYVNYYESIGKVRHYLTKDLDVPSSQDIVAQPQLSHTPDMWLLSGSQRSAKVAAEEGMGLAVGTFLQPNADKIAAAKESIAVYHNHFQRTSLNMEPAVILTVFVIVSDTEEEAQQLLQALDVWLLGKQQFAEFERFPSYNTAKHYSLSERDKQTIQNNRSRIIAGTQDSVKSQLDHFIDTFNADEVLIAPLLPGIEHRARTLELLAQLYL